MTNAPELLFHHYDGSPFSEKIRLAFGRKGLRWRSVIQPNMMPKPHLVPLTGGYRRIPVLQIGADVYCDSQLIARVVEGKPGPTLFPGGSEGVCFAFHWWADRQLFQAAVPAVFEKISAAVPQAFIEDRTALMGGGLDFAAFVRSAPRARDALRAHLALLDAQLADGRAYLLGDAPSFADFASYHPVWFLRAVPPARVHLAEFPRLEGWVERVASVGHGVREECAPEEALRVAREAKPAAGLDTDARDPNGLAAGDHVRVVPDDYGFEPVEGELVGSNVHELALRRSAPEVGEVVVHFPRAGFRVERA